MGRVVTVVMVKVVMVKVVTNLKLCCVEDLDQKTSWFGFGFGD